MFQLSALKTIIRKSKDDFTISWLNACKVLKEKILPFDRLIQVNDGASERTIKGNFRKVGLCECIILPAHAAHHFHAVEQFKLITAIKRSYL